MAKGSSGGGLRILMLSLPATMNLRSSRNLYEQLWESGKPSSSTDDPISASSSFRLAPRMGIGA